MHDPAFLLITARKFPTLSNEEVSNLCQASGCRPVFNPSDDPMSEEDICRLNREYPLSGILVYSSSDRIRRPVFEECKDLRVVSRHGVGIENIDQASAREFGVEVRSTAGLNDFEDVADLTFGLMIIVARKLCVVDRALKSGKWKRPIGTSIWSKTLGIIGLGRIGRAVARRGEAFRMRILAFDPYLKANVVEKPIEMVNLEDLLCHSDFVTLHCPLTDANRGLIGGKELSLMKKEAVLVNTARADLVDQSALIEALRKESIAGAGIDVFSKEPVTTEDAFVKTDLKNLVLTSHIGSFTRENMVHMDQKALKNALEVLGETNWTSKINKL